MIATLRKFLAVNVILLFALLLIMLICLSFGTVRIGLSDVFRALVSGLRDGDPGGGQGYFTIILSIRLPRILLAAVVGGALSVAGSIFQALLRNPLADPYILGVSSGSAVGAVLAMMLGLAATSLGLPLASFLGAIGTVLIVFNVGRMGRRVHTNTLLLAGVIINAFFGAVLMFLISISKTEALHSIIFWLMGDFSFADYRGLTLASPYVLTGALLAYFLARRLNLIVAGEDEASQLGVDVERVKKYAYALASLITAAAVSVCGLIGFVGLMIPHMIRLILGSDHRLLIPAAALWGAGFLVICDTLARSILAPMELPVGVVTAAFGAPFFIYLLKTRSM
ncbi:MAG: iron chelate uptake ABC transporter family permease subunit [Proteobacteria bacterium]|nr:iron chelate uptake ABC transporter family permease subunit [Pseudomonadota bacterium]NIS70589.1 iron chelate uptake ABC transporter family permease subunit [Pseudomonadota bacterium]